MTTVDGRAAAGAAACGVAGAVFLVPTPIGAGSVLFGVSVVAALAFAGRRITPGALVPMLLASAAVVRAAEWVVLPSLASAVVLGSFQLSGSVRRALVLALHVPATMARPIADRWPREGRGVSYVRGAALGIVLVAIFGTLFVTADRAFAQIAVDALVDVDGQTVLLRGLAFVAGAALAGGLARAEREDELVGRPVHVVGPGEWKVALAFLVALFVAFCAVQITVLFAGHDAVLETVGLTYAEYARRGFFQLLAAAALTLGVVAGAARWARREGGRDEVVLRLMLGALCLLTLVILASALRRLGLYEEAFGFTRARLAAHAAMLWIAGVFAAVLGLGPVRPGLLRPTIVWGSAAALLLFAMLNPDGLVARRNVERFTATGDLDAAYLSTLGADAVPALAALPPAPRACVLAPIAARLGPDDPVVAFNLARTRARVLLRDAAAGPCDA